MDPRFLVSDLEKNFEIPNRQKLNLELKEKEFFKLVRKVYSDVRKLI